MICDKCGCEHNSRSVCPKCGERVVFVNEDYERRRREWEEAQKKGNTPAKPEKKAIEKEKNTKKKGFSEMLSLSFAAFKKFLIKVIAIIIVKYRQFKKQKHNKPLIIGVCVAILLAIAIPILIHNLKKRDDSRILCFDKTGGYYVDSMDEIVFGGNSGTKISYSDDNGVITVDETGFDIFYEGKVTRVDAKKPQIIACNDRFSAVFYLSDEGYVFYNGINNPVEYSQKSENIRDCKISDNGEYFAIVAVSEDADNYICYFDYGTANGVTEAERSSEQKSLLDVSEDGLVLFIEMATAEYGIVNDRRAVLYDGESFKDISEIKDYRYIDEVIYYIDDEDRLFSYEKGEAQLIAGAVTGLFDNSADVSSLFYTKDDGYYLAGKEDDNLLPMFLADLSGMTIYYRGGYLYLTDNSALYVVEDYYSGKTPKKICDLNYGSKLIWNANEKCFLTVDGEGNLLKLTSRSSVLKTGVESVMEIENYTGYSYVSGGLRYFVSESGEKAKVADSTEMPEDGQKIMYSKKYFYYHDIYNNLWKIDKKCKKIQRIANVELCIFVD